MNSALQLKNKKYALELNYEFFQNFESDLTKKSYQIDLLQFFDFIRDNFLDVIQYDAVKRFHIVAFKNWLTNSNFAPKTINRKLSAISSFFDFLAEKDLVTFNPCTSVKRPKQSVIHETNDLSDSQIKSLLFELENLKEKSLLHKAIIYLLFTTGIRKAELLSLKLKNYKVKDQFKIIEIKAKGGKFLTKILHPKCIEVLEEYLEYLKLNSSEELHPEDWIFRPTKNPLNPTHLIKPLNPKSIDYIVKSWCKKAGIEKKVSPHSARASYIGSALQNGVDIYKVSRDVGHSSVKTTEEYNKRKMKLNNEAVMGLGFLKE